MDKNMESKSYGVGIKGLRRDKKWSSMERKLNFSAEGVK